MYSSGNISVRNWVHLFESPCITKKNSKSPPECYSIPIDISTNKTT